MNKTTFSLALIALLGTQVLPAAETADTRLFEMRTYYAAPGKLDALHAQFRDHLCKLFEKHGMENIAYWTPAENPDNQIIFLLAYPNQEERDKSWRAFRVDPDWKKAQQTSEAGGRLVVKTEIVSLKPTDFTAVIKPSADGAARVFEMRTYKAAPGRLPNLLARFRDHTVKLFEKHGMKNIGYFTPTDPRQGSEDTLIYWLAHKDQAAAAESFKKFREDPAWVKARADSEQAAGGSLTVNNGVKSVFMTPTEYSPMK